MIRTLQYFWIRFRQDMRGVSAIEFAFIAPVMILFYFGMVETCQIMMSERRTTRVAYAVGDLVARSSGSIEATGSGSIASIFNIADTLMSPFDSGTSLKICLASITADVDDVRTVDWSQAKDGATCPAAGDTVNDIPDGLMSAGESLIMARATYAYSGATNIVIQVDPSFTRTAYHRPRRVTQIDCPSC